MQTVNRKRFTAIRNKDSKIVLQKTVRDLFIVIKYGDVPRLYYVQNDRGKRNRPQRMVRHALFRTDNRRLGSESLLKFFEQKHCNCCKNCTQQKTVFSGSNSDFPKNCTKNYISDLKFKISASQNAAQPRAKVAGSCDGTEKLQLTK
jgi:hypothetical protein